MKLELSNVFKYTALLSVFILTVSCRKDDPDTRSGMRRKIVPSVMSVDTKSRMPVLSGEPVSERVVSASEGFELIEMVYENDFRFSGDGGECTKGSVVTKDNLERFEMDVYAEGAWHDNATSASYPAGLYFSAESVRNGSGWSLSKTGGPAVAGTGDEAGALYWINGVPLTFWGYNAVKPERGGTADKASFSYTVASDVSEQKDPVFAFSSEVRKFFESGGNQGGFESQSSSSGARDEYVNFWFYHAMSAVQFLQHEDMTGYRISNVEIQNVSSHTECELTGSGTVPAAGHPNITFAHTPSVPASFSQEYVAGDGSLVEPEAAGGQARRFKPGDPKTFIMVPQTLGDGTKLKITFTNTVSSGGETTSPVFDLDGSWEPGKYYIYKIDLNGNIHVAISEECSADAKSNVKFQNTSNVNEYIRAAVVANWYDEDGNVVAPWDRGRDGDFTLGQGWTSGSGGFYYYDSPVATKGFTGKLFDSFAKPASEPVTGAHFEMTILVQAVASDGFSSCAAAF